MNKPGNKIFWRFVAAGFAIPCFIFPVLFGGDVKLGAGLTTYIVLILWPSSPLLMSAEAGGNAGELVAFLISAAANALIYGLIGALVGVVYRRFVSSTSKTL